MNKSNGINEQQINKNNDSCWQISYFFNVKGKQELEKKKEEDKDKREEGDRRSNKKRRMWWRKRGNVEEKYKNITRKNVLGQVHSSSTIPLKFILILEIKITKYTQLYVFYYWKLKNRQLLSNIGYIVIPGYQIQ